MKSRKNKKGIPCSRNKLYWINKGFSEEESDTLARSRMPGTFEYFNIFKGYSEDESRELCKNWKSKSAITLENMILKYGVDEGNKRWNSYREKQALTNTFEYKRDKYGWTREQFDEYNKSRSVTLENLIKRHGEEKGRLKWDKYCERQRYAGCQIEYFIEKYGEQEGIEKYNLVNILKSHSYESFLIKNDGNEELATIEYNQYLKFRPNNGNSYSNIANELFDKLFDSIKHIYKDIYYSNNINEWFVYDCNKKRVYYIDFFVKDTGLAIEFHGDYWHANPIKYLPEQLISYPNSVQKVAKQIWEEDEYKTNLIKKHPKVKDILIIWENEYRKNKEQIFELCLNYLLQK